MITLANDLSYLDLRFQGLPRVIATAVLHGPGFDLGESFDHQCLRGGLTTRRKRYADAA